MRILVDTNIVLDILLSREPLYDSSIDALKKAITEETECLVSATAITDIYYILKKEMHDTLKSRESLARFIQLISIADVLSQDIFSAITHPLPDVEDALVQVIAERSKVDYILTRNTKDFTGSTIPAISPEAFLRL